MTSRSATINEPPSQPSALGGGDEKARAKARVGITVNNKWRLDALLGVGGMASVYAATHRNGSRAALKILHTEFARDAGIRDRFLREGYVANKIDHRGRVAILDDDITEQDEPFLVMELLEGETAQQLWKRKGRKVPVPEALWIAAEMLDTLQAFHQQGIVHRDIKPANVFVTKDGMVKVLDFGVARMREAGGDATRAGTALGTPSFMAPEQAMGLADGVDGRADIFSVGASLYAMLSGQRLHQGRTDNEAFILAATTPAPSLARVAPDLPVEVIGLVDRALAWDKRNRFETAAAMRDECVRLMEAFGGSPQRKAEETSAIRRPDDGQSRRATEERQRKAEAAAMPIVEEMKEEVEEDADADDPGVQALIDTFRRLERLLPTIRHYGWAHPETDNKLRATYQAIIEALRADANAVHWKLSPYAFNHRSQTVWEPTAPLDAVPYHLFAAGVRKIQISPGFSEDELRALCEIMLIDPTTDLAPEDDVAAALWEKKLEHIRYDVINVFAEGDAADREAFWAEADDVEEEARRATEEKANLAEAAAMVVETDQAALRAARQAASALALDPVAKKALGAQLAMSPERWSERFVDVIAEAILNARRYKDTELIYEPLDASTRDLVLQRRFDIVFTMFDAIAKALEAYAPRNEVAAIKAEVARGMFTPETFRLTIREAVRVPTPGSPLSQDITPVDLDALTRDLMPVMNALGPSHLEVIFELFSSVTHETLKKTLLAYLERTIPGRESEIVDRVMTLDIEVARPILRILAAVKKPGATEALRRLAGSANAMLRCEATAQLAASPDQLKDDLFQLVESNQPDLRFAALRTLAYHQVKAAGPLLVRRIQDASFHQLGVDERKEILGALFVLHPLRAEQVSLEILQKRGLLTTDEQVEQTRAIAVELMGRELRSLEALQVIAKEAKRRWGNSQTLRDKASVAAEAIAARLGRRITDSGDIQ
ncbi:MAG: serine/threonine-protein kinase [Byssovorax sp.]